MLRHKIIYVLFVMPISVLFTSCTAWTLPSSTSSVTSMVPTDSAKSQRLDFIVDINPAEGTQIPLDFYNKITENGRPRIELARKNGFEAAVCMRIDFLHLVERGDQFLEFEDIYRRMQLEVNDRLVPDIRAYGNVIDAFVAYELDGRPDVQWIDGADYCWYVPLQAGTHEAKFSFQQTSGNIKSYAWQFEIIE